MKNEGIFLSILSPFFPPSICPSSPLRRKCYFGASFWTTRCCCPLARSLSVKSPGGSAWSSQTRPTGFAWVSSLPSQPLPCCPLPSDPRVASATSACSSPPTQPSMLTELSPPFPRDAEGPAGARGPIPEGRRPLFLSDPGAQRPAQVSRLLPRGHWAWQSLPTWVFRTAETDCE